MCFLTASLYWQSEQFSFTDWGKLVCEECEWLLAQTKKDWEEVTSSWWKKMKQLGGKMHDAYEDDNLPHLLTNI